MKELIVSAWFLVAVLLAGLFQEDVPLAHAGTVSENGDVNGDGARDLSDAVYILTHLFQGGDAPLPCPGAAGAGGGPLIGNSLPTTGQTKCYDDADPTPVEVACENAVCAGQDGFYQAGCADAANRFVVNDGGMPGTADDTVQDTCTGLTWQRDTGNGDATLSWGEALAYCEGLTLRGRDDWRLPNVTELFTLVNRGAENPAIYADDFNFNPGSISSPVGYWSSTPYIGDRYINELHVAFQVTFKDGTLGSTAGPSYVRAVRSAVPGNGGAAGIAGSGGARRDGSPQGSGGVTVSGNGDVNADNALDLSDAIFLLTFLFQGGDAPTPCPAVNGSESNCNNNVDDDLDTFTDCDDPDCATDPSCPDSESTLPVTGVTKCYTDIRLPIVDDPDRTASEIDCTQAGPFFGQDGYYQAQGVGCPNENRYLIDERGTMEDTTDDTVTDTCTGLMWQRDNPDGPGELDIVQEYCDALEYCETLDFAAHQDWRLPTVIELQSLVEYSLHTAADPASIAIDFDVFVADSKCCAVDHGFWSSTVAHTNPGSTLRVTYRQGDQSFVGGSGAFLRAVRDANAP